MRTTLTLENDVAARLEAMRGTRTSLKQLINDTLRAGLDRMDQQECRESTYRIQTHHLGRKVANLDKIAEVLASAESEEWR